MNLHRWTWIIFWLLFHTSASNAYWSETHKQFARDINKGNSELSLVEKTESMADYYAERLGFPLDKEYTFDDIVPLSPIPDFFTKKDNGSLTWPVYGATMTGTQIFIQGADDEDYPTARATNHFFDPAHNQSLSESIEVRNEHQVDDWIALNSATSQQAIKTPDWALEDNFEAPSKLLDFNEQTGDYDTEEQQRYSLHDSYNYLFTALTSTDITTRKKQMGEHVYALGHVIHLLTDMGQPEHVRNDVHLASLYEKQTETLAEKDTFSFLPDFFDEKAKRIKYEVKRDKFKKARDYFHTTGNGTGIGLAEFTSRNFVSPTTNFDTQWYSLPTALNESPDNRKDIVSLYGAANVPEDLAGAPLVGEMQFVSSNIEDKQSGTGWVNHFTSSHSIFNTEVNMYHSECLHNWANIVEVPKMVTYPDCKRYTLNKWNYESYRQYLAPRIIAYNVAFLKHLARGTMDIQRSDPNSLGMLDIDPTNKSITQLPISIKNTTPNGEVMGSGKLVAVVTYVDDTSGEVVEAFSSQEIPITSLNNSNFETHPFKFVQKKSDGTPFIDGSGNVIPAAFPLTQPNATTYIQVVFRGQLGEEADIVVVARKPLSELLLLDPIPNSGAYALVDHLPTSTGFKTMKLKLSREAARPLDGTVLPVAMHHINECYQPDLTGEYNVEGGSRDCTKPYRSAKKYYKMATTIEASNILDETQEFDVSFHLPIPFSATDLRIALYHYPSNSAAPLGVSFIDISEPTYISIINNTDHYAYNGTYYSLVDMLDDEQLKAFVEDTNIDATPLDVDIELNGVPSIAVRDLPAGGYSRFALLTKPATTSEASFMFSLQASSSNFRASRSSGLNGAVSQLNSTTNQIERTGLTVLRNVIGHYYIKLEQPYLGGIVDNESLLPAINAANQKEITLVQP